MRAGHRIEQFMRAPPRFFIYKSIQIQTSHMQSNEALSVSPSCKGLFISALFMFFGHTVQTL